MLGPSLTDKVGQHSGRLIVTELLRTVPRGFVIPVGVAEELTAPPRSGLSVPLQLKAPSLKAVRSLAVHGHRPPETPGFTEQRGRLPRAGDC